MYKNWIIRCANKLTEFELLCVICGAIWKSVLLFLRRVVISALKVFYATISNNMRKALFVSLIFCIPFRKSAVETTEIVCAALEENAVF